MVRSEYSGKPVSRHNESVLRFLLCLGILTSPLCAQRWRDLATPLPVPAGSTLVIGFLGGFEQWDDVHRGVRRVALDLRDHHLPKVYVETFSNHSRTLALRMIEQACGNPGACAGVILYGQSWGGAAAIQTARDLLRMNIVVPLTVQVDSMGIHDLLIPRNVKAAANIFQHDPFTIQGQQEIRAEDPAATRILENTRQSYFFRPLETLRASDASWARRTLGGSHAKMELDPALWLHVEELILRALNGTL